MLAVKPCRKFRPATGPISPSANKPATGRPGHVSASTPASWCGSGDRRGPRPLRKLRLRAAEQFAQILVGRLVVADVELHGLAGTHVIADGDGPAIRIGA